MDRSDIKAAASRGQISMETMAKALEGDARAVAWTQWLLDGNDGPQSPPEGWREEVTAEPLDIVVDIELTRDSWSWGSWRIRGDIPGWECVSRLSPEMDGLDSLKLWFSVIGKVCERAAINARREGSK